jgi:hypothetical protein
MICVEAALQVLIGGCIRFEERLPVQEGDVLVLNLPLRPQQQCLVVSSPGVDAIREGIWIRARNSPLGYCTVVPLEQLGQSKDEDRGVAPIDVYPTDGKKNVTSKLAICQEVYTVDWRSRIVDSVERRIGRVRFDHMDRVREKLRDYLDLPK